MYRLAHSLFSVLLSSPFAFADPIPKVVKEPISPANAPRVHPVLDHVGDVHRIARGPGIGELTFVGWEKPVEVVDEITLRPIRTLVEGAPIHFAATTNSDRIAWCENTTTVTVRQTASGKSIEIDTKNSQPGMAFSPDGTLLVTGGYSREAKVWDADGKLVHSLDVGTVGGLTPVFSPDGKTLAIGNRNDQTCLFETTTGKLLHTLPQKLSQGLTFSPDGKTLAIGYVNGSITLWDVQKGESLRSAKTACEEVYRLEWNPKGDVLVSAGRAGKIELWNPKTLKSLCELEGGEWVISVRFSADGCRLFTAGGSMYDNKKRKVTAWTVKPK